jgi:hypothetical protein
MLFQPFILKVVEGSVAFQTAQKWAITGFNVHVHKYIYFTLLHHLHHNWWKNQLGSHNRVNFKCFIPDQNEHTQTGQSKVYVIVYCVRSSFIYKMLISFPVSLILSYVNSKNASSPHVKWLIQLSE